MTGKKESDIAWRHTSVVLQADIFAKAHEQGIDISNVCNRALADLLGVDYHKQQHGDVPLTRPVIIAQNGQSTGEEAPAQAIHTAAHTAVINADDPAASLKVRSAKRQPKVKPATKEPVNVPPLLPSPESAVASPSVGTASSEKIPKPSGTKAHKDDGLKKFVTTRITRIDASDAVVSKDDMYQAFTRFCREHKHAPVPDRKSFTIALKNKFAFFDKTINGIPSWVNVRLQ